MSRRWPSPVLLAAGHSACSILPPLHQAQAALSEKQLQDIIEDHPDVLPTDYFDEAFAPPVCIGREVVVRPGRIDHLLVSPRGYVTIVETKLWKSPEAHRQVVAQIVDYAANVSSLPLISCDYVVSSWIQA